MENFCRNIPVGVPQDNETLLRFREKIRYVNVHSRRTAEKVFLEINFSPFRKIIRDLSAINL